MSAVCPRVIRTVKKKQDSIRDGPEQKKTNDAFTFRGEGIYGIENTKKSLILAQDER